MMVALIAAVAKNGIIGAKNDLPWYIPEDLKHFKALTIGKTVLMGRKTFESILKRLGKPLPNRKNVAVTRDVNYAFHPHLASPIKGEETTINSPPLVGGVRGGGDSVGVYHSIDDALAAHKGADIMVIGGGEIFTQTIARAAKLHITEVDKEITGDTYFPPIDQHVWKEVAREPHEGFSFVTYERR